jgi:hypothetical protein
MIFGSHDGEKIAPVAVQKPWKANTAALRESKRQSKHALWTTAKYSL